MYFNSLDFLFFFIIVYVLYLFLDHRKQNIMLLVASYFFYGCWDWRFLCLLLISTIVDYFCGIRIHTVSDPKTRKKYLWLSIICNLGILGFFKYFNFFADSCGDLLNIMGLQVNPWSLKIILPVGISFYTFQTMSYTIDIYRKEMEPTRNFLNFALFVSFFPQLVAGPIERAKRLLPQIEKKRQLNPIQIKEGIFLVTWGLFKKIIIADNMAGIVNYNLANYTETGGLGIILGLYAFAGQLYGDFSGYSDIARGLAKLMGFELMVNFKLPYFAVRPTDFWARWHISLTSWVRDYYFFSIGSIRDTRLKTAWNNIITMTLIGLWHGAAWTFVIWGFFFGLIQAGYGLIRPILKKFKPKSPAVKTVVKLLSMFLMFHTFYVSGLFFRAENMTHSTGMIHQLFTNLNPCADRLHDLLFILYFSAPLIILQVAQYRSNDLLIILKQKSIVQFIFYLTLIFMVLSVYLFGANVKGGEEFIYFQF